jgi:hypothetical protein
VNATLGCPLCLACRTSFASLVVNAAADYGQPDDGQPDDDSRADRG